MGLGGIPLHASSAVLGASRGLGGVWLGGRGPGVLGQPGGFGAWGYRARGIRTEGTRGEHTVSVHIARTRWEHTVSAHREHTERPRLETPGSHARQWEAEYIASQRALYFGSTTTAHASQSLLNTARTPYSSRHVGKTRTTHDLLMTCHTIISYGRASHSIALRTKRPRSVRAGPGTSPYSRQRRRTSPPWSSPLGRSALGRAQLCIACRLQKTSRETANY